MVWLESGAYNADISKYLARTIMYQHRSRGFTLIELLVVIAIIGVLSSVVLASLNTARNKGNDASIQANLATVRTQAELYYDEQGHKYSTTDAASAAWGSTAVPSAGLFSNTTIAQALVSAASATGSSGAADAGTYAIGQSGTSYAIAVKLKDDPTKSWCVDSTGAAKQESSAAPALGGGAGAAAVCP